MDLTLKKHPVLDLSKTPDRVTIYVDETPLTVDRDQTLAAALWSKGILTLGHDETHDTPRGMYCGIGHCHQCRVKVDGTEDVRSCLTKVKPNMQVEINPPKKDAKHPQ